MSDDYRLNVPPGFDDSDADSQVHPIARLMFDARTNAEAFGKAQRWVETHDVRVMDVSWDHWAGEDFTVSLTIYFTFEYGPEAEAVAAGG